MVSLSLKALEHLGACAAAPELELVRRLFYKGVDAHHLRLECYQVGLGDVSSVLCGSSPFLCFGQLPLEGLDLAL